MELQISKKCIVPKFYPLLFDYSHRWEVYMGSAGSSKSWFITQKIIIKALNEERRVFVCRRYGSTIKQTVFAGFKEVLKSFKIYQYCKINESTNKITLPNGSEILFSGLDEETKLLSLTNISDIFIEECFEVNKDMVEQLNLRMRGKAKNQQIFMAFNPINRKSWLYEFCEQNHPDSFLYTHSTYKDNPFLNKSYIQALENLYKTNPAKAKIYCDGDWGVNPEGLVFNNWKIEEFNISEIAKKFEHRCGSDLGWNDKTSIIESFYDKENKIIYVANEFYKSGQQLSDILNAIVNMRLDKSKIYFDCAEPRSIQYFKNNRINAVPSIKGADSVKAGLMFLQDNKIIVNPVCVNLIMELENFSYIKSRLTGEYTEETTHEYSHAIDGLRYAYCDIYSNNRVTTFSKSLLGL